MYNITQGQEGRKALKEGVDKIANAVKSTMGAAGNTVIISQKFGSPLISKDGLTVTNAIEGEDLLERQAIEMVKQVARESNKKAGDGSTTFMVLVQALIEAGFSKNINRPVNFKRGMEYALEKVLEYLESVKTEVGDNYTLLEQIATVSANNNEKVGKVIAAAFKDKGKYRDIKIRQSDKNEVTLELSDGFQTDTGSVSDQLLPADTLTRVIENPYIIITDLKVNHLKNFVNEVNYSLLEDLSNKNKGIVLICSGIDTQTLSTFETGYLAAGLDIMCISAPDFGQKRIDIMEDLATLTGGRYFSTDKEDKLSNITMDDLGKCLSVEVTQDTTTFFCEPEAIKRAEEITKNLEARKEKERDRWRVDEIEERIARLNGGLGLIYVGSETLVETTELVHRVEDAVNATKSALVDGVVAGGGIALMRLKNIDIPEGSSEDFTKGVNTVIEAISAPFKTIMTNAHLNPYEVFANIGKGQNDGYNVKTDQYGDMFEMGILDPCNVTKTALKNAVSVTSTIMSTDVVIT